MDIVTQKGNLEEFNNQEKLFVFEPNQRAADSWLTLEDAPVRKKAKLFYFETMAKKHYMTPVQKDGREYAKIYMVEDSENVAIIYVEKYTVCQKERYYRK